MVSKEPLAPSRVLKAEAPVLPFGPIHRLRMAQKRMGGREHLVAMGVIAACFVAWASAFIYKSSFTIDGKRYFCLFDDAMISMRYARNLAEGHGLVWNSGEYVEGYTNPLMTLLMSLSNLLFKDVGAVLSVQVAGAGFVLVNACLVA